MKIQNKEELRKILSYEKSIYKKIGYKNFLVSIIRKSQIDLIYTYVKLLRKEEYYENKWYYILSKNITKIKKNKLGNKLGMYIPAYTFEKGLTIYHPYGIIVHSNAKIGSNCKLHGDVCIGNDGKNDNSIPVLGNNVDIGVGAKIIGNVKIGNNVTIGANTVVLKGVYSDNSVLVGVPAKMKK